MECKHKWVDMEDGSLRKFCVRCTKFAMQNRLSMPMEAEMSVPITRPIAREKVEVPFFVGLSIGFSRPAGRLLNG